MRHSVRSEVNVSSTWIVQIIFRTYRGLRHRISLTRLSNSAVERTFLPKALTNTVGTRPPPQTRVTGTRISSSQTWPSIPTTKLDREHGLRFCGSLCSRSTTRFRLANGPYLSLGYLPAFVPYPHRQVSGDIDPSPASRHGQLSRTSYAQTTNPVLLCGRTRLLVFQP